MVEQPKVRVTRDVVPPQPVEVHLWVSAAELDTWFPALLHEWEGRGPEGLRSWKGRLTLEVEPPPSWSDSHPWVPSERIRPREVGAVTDDAASPEPGSAG